MSRGLCGLGAGVSSAKWWLWTLLGLLAIFALMWLSKRAPIENDIQHRTTSALVSQGHDWATVDLDGRDVTLGGAAPSAEARINAIDIAKKVDGVRIVEDQTSELQLGSASYGLSHEGDKVLLSGSMPTQELIDSSVSAAASAFGAENLINRMNVDSGVNAPSWLEGLNAMMPNLAGLREANIDVNDGKITFAGLVENDGIKGQLLSAANKLFPSGFSESISVRSSGPSAEELAQAAADKAAKLAADQAAAKAEAAAQAKAEAEKMARVQFIKSCQSRLNSTMEGQSINFASGSATIDLSSYPLLGRIAALIAECKGAVRESSSTIEVSGHTDSAGDAELNLNLSALRANAVRDYLVGAGAPADLLNANGYGEDQPVGDNATTAGRVQNRRIQFDIKQNSI